MGEVKEKIRLRNYVTVGACELGVLKQEDILCEEVEMLVDTGAVMCLLPQDLVDVLKLQKGEPRVVTYADDRKEELDTALGLELTIGNRRMVTDCFIGPPRCEPLLGQIVLEELDLLVDCPNNRLIVNPESPYMPMVKLK